MINKFNVVVAQLIRRFLDRIAKFKKSVVENLQVEKESPKEQVQISKINFKQVKKK